MTVICADPSMISLYGLRRKLSAILPNAKIYYCNKTETALQIAKEEGCDVLITEIDFGRDKGEGINMAEKISNTISEVNIIFATGASYIDYASLIMKMKFSGYLTKPYSTEDLERELFGLRFKKCV